MATSEDLTAKLMNDMDSTLLDFVKTKVTSFIKWDLLRFLHENPYTTDSAENIACYTGRNVNAVRPELDDLVESSILEQRMLDETAIYSLTQDNDTRHLIETFITACQDRRFRVKAVYHIIKNMR